MMMDFDRLNVLCRLNESNDGIREMFEGENVARMFGAFGKAAGSIVLISSARRKLQNQKTMYES